MNKFKVGEKVKVRDFNEQPRHWNSEGKMNKYMGKKVTISQINNNYIHPYLINDDRWHWKESDFEEIVVFDFLLSDKDVLL